MDKENTLKLIRRPLAPTWVCPNGGEFPNAYILLNKDIVELDFYRQLTFTLFTNADKKTPFFSILRVGVNALDLVIETDEIDDSVDSTDDLEPNEVKYKRYILSDYITNFGFPTSFADLKIISWGLPSITTLPSYLSTIEGTYTMTSPLAEEYLYNTPLLSISNGLGETDLSNWMIEPNTPE